MRDNEDSSDDIERDKLHRGENVPCEGGESSAKLTIMC